MSYVKENKYLITKMLLNQFGSMILGLMMYLAASAGNKSTILLIAGIISVFFYMYLNYTMMWDVGARDIIRVEGKRLKYNPLNGFYISLFANIPNFLIGIFVLIGRIFGSADGSFGFEWAGNMYLISKSAGIVWEAMFNPFVELYSPNNPIIWLLMPFPPMIASFLGYYLGMKNCRFLIGKTKHEKGRK